MWTSGSPQIKTIKTKEKSKAIWTIIKTTTKTEGKRERRTEELQKQAENNE